MLEVTSISASSYDPESLVPLLDERVKDGWSVISIVSAGTKVVAYLQRDTESAPAAADEATSPVDEPAGWATAPEEDDGEPDAAPAGAVAGATGAAVAASAVDAPAEPVAASETPSAEPTQEPAATQAAAAPQPESTVPAGWYADPSGRFELRYWDGGAWTEHVSRAGQQFTDPPVA